jgi:hypothetical protein
MLGSVTGMAAIGGYMMLMGKSSLPPSETAPSSIPIPSTSKAIISAPQPTASVSRSSAPSADTSTWEIYQNTAYGFSFRYPSFLTKSESFSNGPLLHLYACREGFKDNRGKVIRCAKDEYAIRLSIVDKPYDAKSVLQFFDAHSSTSFSEFMIVDGREAYIGANAAFNLEEWLVQISFGRKTLIISFSGNGYIQMDNSNASQEGLQKVKQILSTFDFQWYYFGELLKVFTLLIL